MEGPEKACPSSPSAAARSNSGNGCSMRPTLVLHLCLPANELALPTKLKFSSHAFHPPPAPTLRRNDPFSLAANRLTEFGDYAVQIVPEKDGWPFLVSSPSACVRSWSAPTISVGVNLGCRIIRWPRLAYKSICKRIRAWYVTAHSSSGYSRLMHTVIDTLLTGT